MRLHTFASAVTAVILILVGFNAHAKKERVLYALSSTTIFLGGADGKPIGILKIGASVIPIKKQGGFYEIKVKGWQIKGLPSTVFAFKGIRVAKMELTPEGDKALKVIKKVQDKTTGLLWKEVELDNVWVKASDLTANKKEVWKSASKLFHERCSMCHALPKSTQFTANQWPATLRVMTKRAALDKKQTEMVSLFLQYHARDTINR